MKDWQEKLKNNIDSAAEEIMASAFETFLAADKLVTGARIVISIDSDCLVRVTYEVDVFPREGETACRES